MAATRGWENKSKCIHAWPEMEEGKWPAGLVHAARSASDICVKMSLSRISPETMQELKWIVLPRTRLCSVTVGVLICCSSLIAT